ncbi:trypsin, putative [Eimeria tenella]|uniref:Trypsin, putative n=1 Tax=Eimeria tenella TaxID=5802 RepID=U6KRF9_EIMTE|nr:trypsin, putative [Eimeria tenella]CDJ40717.1 trypsin, putative [Eimeria tenella]|eukprot:XP_013231467.1 trypsin, putative [Eimeria tenella]
MPNSGSAEGGEAAPPLRETRLSKRKSTDGAVAAEAASVVAEAAAKRGRRPAAGGKSPSLGTSAVPHMPEAPCNGHVHHPSRAAHLPVHRESDAETKEAIIRSEIPKSVVKVFCTHCEPNYSQPWTTRRQTSSTSTGFVTVDAGGSHCILTNAHSVDNAAVVQVRRRGDHQKHEARVICIGLDCDLAMLQVDDPDFWDGIGPPLEWGPSPSLEDPVTVAGYPLGGDNSSVTQGVVSRTDLQQYSMGSCWLLAIQIDAAINPGNSGGPALNKEKQCVGIAFQSLKDGDTENIGYIIPSEVVVHFLEDFQRHKKYTGFGDCGFTWQKLENRFMRSALSLKSKQQGVLVKKVDGASYARDVLQRGDIVLAVNGNRVASDGSVSFRNGERILFSWLFAQLFVGDRCSLTILRRGKQLEVSYEVGKVNLLVPATNDLPRPEYLIVGGLVFVPLSEPFLKSEYGDDFESRAPVRLLDRWQHGMQQFPGQQCVILTHVLAHEITVGFEHLHNIQVVAFNGEQVRTLRHLKDLVEASTDEFWRFDLDHEEVVILKAASARSALKSILSRNLIPSHKSEGL